MQHTGNPVSMGLSGHLVIEPQPSIQKPTPQRLVFYVHCTGVCHTDAFTLCGDDPEGHFLLFWATKARASWSRWAKA